MITGLNMSVDADNDSAAKDSYFQRIRGSTKSSAVDKTEFATFSSSVPEGIKIFSFEGRDDKIIYDHWIRRIAFDVAYEPYVSKNKRSNLQLFDSLQRDLTGLGQRVYFFVDRDFDDLQDRAAHEKLFMTEKYSVESYLVCNNLLEELLKVEFHCNGYLSIRKRIIEIFKLTYNSFLDVTKELNFRAFIAAREKIRRTEDIPPGINMLANVGIDSVTSAGIPVDQIIKLEREPTEEEVVRWREEFEAFDPAERYRGKFALAFFVKWLSLLRQDRLSQAPTCFAEVPLPDYGVKGNFSFDSLAPRAAFPDGLPAFLARD
nr:DUF4435 domain-containing protein [uncultured Cupriavidus sp.]